jgi:hypothetical protein
LGINTLGHWFLVCHFQVAPAEAPETKQEISGEGTEDATPIPKKKRQKLCNTSEDECLNQAMKIIMNRIPDACDTYGEYVAMELRSIRSATLQTLMKRDIGKVIARYAELDLNCKATCSTKVTEV